MKVCEKVQRKGTTSYNEVADELVAEFSAADNHILPNESVSVCGAGTGGRRGGWEQRTAPTPLLWCYLQPLQTHRDVPRAVQRSFSRPTCSYGAPSPLDMSVHVLWLCRPGRPPAEAPLAWRGGLGSTGWFGGAVLGAVPAAAAVGVCRTRPGGGARVLEYGQGPAFRPDLRAVPDRVESSRFISPRRMTRRTSDGESTMP